MKPADIPSNERERLHALKEYSILDTLPEPEFEDITRIASEICQTPISLITLIDSDRQWFKSNHGLSVTETPRDYAFCAHAINKPGSVFSVKDSREDDRFADNPLVTGYPNVIFYVGVPLINPQGFSIGTLCVIDNKPRELTKTQIDSLKSLSNQVVKLFELKKVNRLLSESQEDIKMRNIELEKFAYVVSHDIKSPLNNIISLIDILKDEQKGKMNSKGEEIVNHISNSSLRLKSLIDGIITHYTGVNTTSYETKEIDVKELCEELVELLDPRHEFNITHDLSANKIIANEVALKQILLNLLSNAIKYNDKGQVKITIRMTSDNENYFFSIEDNGQGIDESEFSKIFETFVTLGSKDRFNNVGTGIGLSTVKRIVEKLNGSIEIESKVGVGSNFKFRITK